MSLDAKSLIMGAAFGYSQNQIDNFLTSLAAVNFNGKVLLFIHSDQERLDNRGVDVSFVITPNRKYADDDLVPSSRRHFIMQRYLDSLSFDGHILLTDVRDVVFQKSPFEYRMLDKYSILYALEERIIGDCSINSNWIEKRYGPGILSRMRGFPISCSGTVTGSSNAVREYLQKMCSHLTNSPSIMGIDQGVHNYIAYYEPLKNQAFQLNGFSDILTINYMKFLRMNGGIAINYDGTVPAILHQYDRLSQDSQMRIDAINSPIQLPQ